MWGFLYKNLNNPINLFIEMKSITLKALKNGKIKRKPSHSAYPTSTFESNLCSNIHFSLLKVLVGTFFIALSYLFRTLIEYEIFSYQIFLEGYFYHKRNSKRLFCGMFRLCVVTGNVLMLPIFIF